MATTGRNPMNSAFSCARHERRRTTLSASLLVLLLSQASAFMAPSFPSILPALKNSASFTSPIRLALSSNTRHRRKIISTHVPHMLHKGGADAPLELDLGPVPMGPDPFQLVRTDMQLIKGKIKRLADNAFKSNSKCSQLPPQNVADAPLPQQWQHQKHL